MFLRWKSAEWQWCQKSTLKIETFGWFIWKLHSSASSEVVYFHGWGASRGISWMVVCKRWMWWMMMFEVSAANTHQLLVDFCDAAVTANFLQLASELIKFTFAIRLLAVDSSFVWSESLCKYWYMIGTGIDRALLFTCKFENFGLNSRESWSELSEIGKFCMTRVVWALAWLV